MVEEATKIRPSEAPIATIYEPSSEYLKKCGSLENNSDTKCEASKNDRDVKNPPSASFPKNFKDPDTSKDFKDPDTSKDFKDPRTSKDFKRISFPILYISLFFVVLFLVAISLLFYSSSNIGSRDIIVDGEFKITNAYFDSELLDKTSDKFTIFSSGIANELDYLFESSDLEEQYVQSRVLEIHENLNVKYALLLKNGELVNVGKIGMQFIRGLRSENGHMWLGPYTIDIQSIGFQIRGEEGMWSEWSDWKGCEAETDAVASRTRKCLLRETKRTINVERCLLIPGNKGDLDLMPCSEYRKKFIR